MFEVKYRDGLARIGVLETKSGKITTPALLPVINPTQILISPKELKENFRCEAIITNSYIIYNNEILKKECLEKGLRSTLDFGASIMTDSGSFQAYEYGDLEINNEEILGFQTKIDSDIVTMLDVISPLDRKYSDSKNDVLETIERAKQAVAKKEDRLLACTVQGGLYPDLREYCAKELSKLECDIFAIGGVVPLLESYRFEVLVNIVLTSKKELVPSRPVHLFGCGHPIIFPVAVLLGCDLFDSASYAKYAKAERLVFPEGTKALEEIGYSPCVCPVCNQFEELKELDKQERVKRIAEHNLYVSFGELAKVKQAIYENNLWELVEQRCTVHPSLGNLLKVIARYKEFLEKFDNLSRKSFFYSCKESLERPSVYRYEKRLFERYEKPKDTKILVVLPESRKPYGRTYSGIIREVLKVTNAHFVVNSCIAPVPIELAEIYPIAHVVMPEKIYREFEERCEKSLKNYLDHFDYSMALLWNSEETLEALKLIAEKKYIDYDILRLQAVANMQFGKNAGKALFENKDVRIIKSKTGRIRNVFIDTEHALSVRNDGFFSLKLKGARLLHSFFQYPKLRVAVNKEAVEFIERGRNLFAKFVEFCDEELRPYDEVLIVDKQDNLLGVGRALLNSQEMLSFKRGIAVKVRKLRV
ncbi:MAG: tRNA guanosine(15) transglycosylase TgtA [Candidatus Thermoplasmatota archaeon]|nr:tRNA guanosine(15) transglycosylase TgtA [Candidatus Thermoplasmatota archaeon]